MQIPVALLEHIAGLAGAALKEEVLLTPKPGLVDCQDQGAHSDMDAALFLISIEALQPFFLQYIVQGYQSKEAPAKLFQQIREIGKAAERAMFQATNGINTHKGAQFSLALILTSLGYWIRQKQIVSLAQLSEFLTIDELFAFVRQLTANILEEDLKQMSHPAQTHGEQLYVQYGIGGIREEAHQGFPSLRLLAYPELERQRTALAHPRQLYLHLLFYLMSHVDDSNVLHRGGLAGLQYVKQTAMSFLQNGGILQEAYETEIALINQAFIDRNLSPGGCADLLALTIFLHQLYQKG